MRQNGAVSSNFSTKDNWVILSKTELNIKKKIEEIGIPLKDWDIKIYRGILTGCNDAFIVSTEKRNEIMANCLTEEERLRTEELIRPILRGQDIKRFGYEWNNRWLIHTHNGINNKVPRIDIQDYPAIKAHLDQYWDQISSRTDKGDTPYNLRNCIYWDDFSKPKILYPDIMRLPRSVEKLNSYPYITIDTDCFVPEATLFMMTGEKINDICQFLCSEIGFFAFTKFYMGPVFDNTGFRYKKEYLLNLPIPIIDNLNCTDYECALCEALNLSKLEKELIFSYKQSLINAHTES